MKKFNLVFQTQNDLCLQIRHEMCKLQKVATTHKVIMHGEHEDLVTIFQTNAEARASV